MRALLVTNMWPTADRPDKGIFVADQAAALRKLGVDLEVFAFESGSITSYLRAAAKLARKRKTTYDVVHAHFGLSAWVALAAKGRVRAVTFHGTDLEHPRSRKLSGAVLRFIDLPAAVSRPLADRVPRSHLQREPLVLPCGISLERFKHTRRSEARKRLGFAEDERLILLPSDPTRPEKRADRARQLAERTNSRLVTLGGIDPKEVPLWINSANVVVIPSEREGFGLALLEALACGTPVMSTQTGIAPAALDGIDGALCADWDADVWSNAAINLIDRSDPINALGRVEQWSSDTCARDVLEAWRDALTEAGACAHRPASASE